MNLLRRRDRFINNTDKRLSLRTRRQSKGDKLGADGAIVFGFKGALGQHSSRAALL